MRQPIRALRLPTFVPSCISLPPGTSPYQAADEYAAAWERWFRELVTAPSWFITLTFSPERLPPPTAKHAQVLFLEWTRWAEREALSARKARNPGLPWVNVMEPHANGTPHIHAIFCGCPQLDFRGLGRKWGHGRSQIEHYDEERDGIGYLAKDVAHGTYPDLSRALRRSL